MKKSKKHAVENGIVAIIFGLLILILLTPYLMRTSEQNSSGGGSNQSPPQNNPFPFLYTPALIVGYRNNTTELDIIPEYGLLEKFPVINITVCWSNVTFNGTKNITQNHTEAFIHKDVYTAHYETNRSEFNITISVRDKTTKEYFYNATFLIYNRTLPQLNITEHKFVSGALQNTVVILRPQDLPYKREIDVKSGR